MTSKTPSLLARRGFSTIEILVALACGSALSMMMMSAYNGMGTGFQAGSAEAAVLSEAQMMFRHLATDVTSAQLIATSESLDRCDFARDRKLILVVSKPSGGENTAGSTAAGRDAATDGSETWPMLEVIYRYEPGPTPGAPASLIREEIEGILTRKEVAVLPSGRSEFDYSFQGGAPKRSVLSRHLSRMSILPLPFTALAPGEAPLRTSDSVLPIRRHLVAWGEGSGLSTAAIAGIALSVNLVQEALEKSRKSETLDIVTKLWMEAATLSFRYDHDFSTRDDDLGS